MKVGADILGLYVLFCLFFAVLDKKGIPRRQPVN